MKLKRILCMVSAGTLLVLGSAAAQDARTKSLKNGKGLFEIKCEWCHGPTGKGKPDIADLYDVKMRPLGSKEVQARTDADLKRIVTTGQGKMGGRARELSDHDISDLVAFLRTLKQ
jgi:cytochrome c553